MQPSLSLSSPVSMQRAIRTLVLLLGVQLALAVVLALRTDPLSTSTPQTALIGAAAERADRLVIDSNPSEGAAAATNSIVLEKRNGHWVLPQFFDAPAREAQVSSLLSELAGLKRGLPVGTSSSALKRFKLTATDFERRVQLSQNGKTLGTIYLGSSSGVHKSYARASDDHAAYNVDLASFDLPVQQSDWLDAGIAARDLGNLGEMDITTEAHQSLQLRHASATRPAPPGASSNTAASSAGGWTEANASSGHELDGTAVAALASDVSSLQVQGVLGQQPKPEWQVDHPALTLSLKGARASEPSVTWVLSKPSSADYYVLKSSRYPWFFQVASGTGKDLIDASQPSKLFKGAAAQAATLPGAKSAARSSNRIRPHPSAGSQASSNQ